MEMCLSGGGAHTPGGGYGAMAGAAGHTTLIVPFPFPNRVGLCCATRPGSESWWHTFYLHSAHAELHRRDGHRHASVFATDRVERRLVVLIVLGVSDVPTARMAGEDGGSMRGWLSTLTI